MALVSAACPSLPLLTGAKERPSHFPLPLRHHASRPAPTPIRPPAKMCVVAISALLPANISSSQLPTCIRVPQITFKGDPPKLERGADPNSKKASSLVLVPIPARCRSLPVPCARTRFPNR